MDCEGVWVSGLCIRTTKEPPTLPPGGMLLDLGLWNVVPL